MDCVLSPGGASETAMYAVLIEADPEKLRKAYRGPYNDPYLEIRTVLKRFGLEEKKPGLYFGNEQTNSVSCVLATLELAKKCPWLVKCAKEMTLLRIEERSDLGYCLRRGEWSSINLDDAEIQENASTN
jgi:virulence-associated protein VapD